MKYIAWVLVNPLSQMKVEKFDDGVAIIKLETDGKLFLTLPNMEKTEVRAAAFIVPKFNETEKGLVIEAEITHSEHAKFIPDSFWLQFTYKEMKRKVLRDMVKGFK